MSGRHLRFITTFLAKLRDMELAGNKQAQSLLERFEKARADPDPHHKLALEMERTVLDEAFKLELLTPLEKVELERIFNDRHRCAHPSLQSLDEPYEPTAELARAHMRHAVTSLLGRPPVQGREARAGILEIIKSSFFPENIDDAHERLSTRLRRAKISLVRDVTIDLIKALLSPVGMIQHALACNPEHPCS
jgi:hypothetical protein